MTDPLRIAVLDDFQGAAQGLADWQRLSPRASVEFLNRNFRGDALSERLQEFDILVGIRERTRFTRELIESLPRLKLLISTGPRNLSLDVDACRERGITVCNTETGSNATAELTWALILGLSRNIAREDHALREGHWQTSLGFMLEGKTLGIVGLGRLGQRVARIGSAFGMNVIAWSQNLTAEAAAQVGCLRVDKAELFARSDVVSVHVVLSERTTGLVGEPELAAMKPSAIIVNTARSQIIDEAALIAALREKRIAGAALDVFADEPIPMDAAIRRAPNTLLTPHLGYVTRDGFTTYFTQAVENIEAWLNDTPIRVVTRPG